VIEDYADSREMLRLLLKNVGYHVITARDGREALRVAADERLDLVLADLGLPDMSGFTVVRRLRKLTYSLRNVRIIMLTAFEGDEISGSAIELAAPQL
jgi:DNA-binding response OmpR family regulator